MRGHNTVQVEIKSAVGEAHRMALLASLRVDEYHGYLAPSSSL